VPADCWSLTLSSRQPDSARHRVTINVTRASTSPDTLPDPIQDLCHSILNANEKKVALDFYLSGCGSLCCRNTLVQAGTATDLALQFREVLTLEKVLCNALGSTNALSGWALSQRVALRFTVASSLVQLNSTPWLERPLTKQQIFFLWEGSQSDSPIAQPFIPFTFPDQPTVSAGPSEAKRSTLELRIILLEWWHFTTIEAYASEAQHKLDNTFGRRYDVAESWLDISCLRILPFYLDAVTRCIKCTFATSLPSPDWSDVVFRKSVCEYVLKPLWENCPAMLRQ
jgi:hypothetical protein